jgi:hypothetical protein
MMSMNDFVTNLAEQITIAFVGEINVRVQEQFTANDPMRIIEILLKDSCFPIAVISHVDGIAAITVTKSELSKPVLINEFESPYEIKLKNAINKSTRERLIGSVIHVYMNKDGAIAGSTRIISTITES